MFGQILLESVHTMEPELVVARCVVYSSHTNYEVLLQQCWHGYQSLLLSDLSWEIRRSIFRNGMFSWLILAAYWSGGVMTRSLSGSLLWLKSTKSHKLASSYPTPVPKTLFTIMTNDATGTIWWNIIIYNWCNGTLRHNNCEQDLVLSYTYLVHSAELFAFC